MTQNLRNMAFVQRPAAEVVARTSYWRDGGSRPNNAARQTLESLSRKSEAGPKRVVIGSKLCIHRYLRRSQHFLLPAPPRRLDRNFERLRHSTSRRQRQPLRQRDSYHSMTLVNLDPLQYSIQRGVLYVAASALQKDGGVARGEVEGAGRGLLEEEDIISWKSCELVFSPPRRHLRYRRRR